MFGPPASTAPPGEPTTIMSMSVAVPRGDPVDAGGRSASATPVTRIAAATVSPAATHRATAARAPAGTVGPTTSGGSGAPDGSICSNASKRGRCGGALGAGGGVEADVSADRVAVTARPASGRIRRGARSPERSARGDRHVIADRSADRVLRQRCEVPGEIAPPRVDEKPLEGAARSTDDGRDVPRIEALDISCDERGPLPSATGPPGRRGPGCRHRSLPDRPRAASVVRRDAACGRGGRRATTQPRAPGDGARPAGPSRRRSTRPARSAATAGLSRVTSSAKPLRLRP